MANPKDKRARQPPSRDVQVSKALSHLLRHAAEKEGVKMTAQGYANVSDVVCTLPTFASRAERPTNAVMVPAKLAQAQIPQNHIP
jgi:RNA:NAD 2'-phosphotransferase (TPT1/KptA family)